MGFGDQAFPNPRQHRKIVLWGHRTLGEGQASAVASSCLEGGGSQQVGSPEGWLHMQGANCPQLGRSFLTQYLSWHIRGHTACSSPVSAFSGQLETCGPCHNPSPRALRHRSQRLHGLGCPGDWCVPECMHGHSKLSAHAKEWGARSLQLINRQINLAVSSAFKGKDVM